MNSGNTDSFFEGLEDMNAAIKDLPVNQLYDDSQFDYLLSFAPYLLIASLAFLFIKKLKKVPEVERSPVHMPDIASLPESQKMRWPDIATLPKSQSKIKSMMSTLLGVIAFCLYLYYSGLFDSPWGIIVFGAVLLIASPIFLAMAILGAADAVWPKSSEKTVNQQLSESQSITVGDVILGVCVISVGYILIWWLYMTPDFSHLEKLRPIFLAVFCNSAIFLVARYYERKFDAGVPFPRRSSTQILLLPLIALGLITSFRLVYCGEEDMYCSFFRQRVTASSANKP